MPCYRCTQAKADIRQAMQERVRANASPRETCVVVSCLYSTLSLARILCTRARL
jgi:hypothetical protein